MTVTVAEALTGVVALVLIDVGLTEVTVIIVDGSGGGARISDVGVGLGSRWGRGCVRDHSGGD